MLIQRERPRASARLLMPSPAPLPNLREALARRAEVFGPFDLDELPVAPLGVLARCGAALRGLANLLDPTPPWSLREAGGARPLTQS